MMPKVDRVAVGSVVTLVMGMLIASCMFSPAPEFDHDPYRVPHRVPRYLPDSQVAPTGSHSR